MAELNFEILANIGVIGEGTRGWKKEVNIVKWNGRNPKVDIRDWDESHTKMGRGVTLSKEEVMELKELIADFEPEQFGI